MLSTLAKASPVAARTAQRALLPCVSLIPSRLPYHRYFSTTPRRNKPDEQVIILGAAGRDFHDFITYWSKQPDTVVKAFTAQQIPGIDNRRFPAELCNNQLNGNRYPTGLEIRPESTLEQLIQETEATTCALAYSDLKYDTVQSLASRVNAAGCKFVQLPPKFTMVPSTKPVVAICASRTGVGKSQTTRYVANYFKNKGLKVAVVRHPMPYDKDLLSQACQRYEKLEDMDKYHCTIEEREEYFRHIEDGNLLFAGVDYPTILREAEKEADVILWDGGNNDFPFFKPDLHLTLVDALRPMDEEHYYPGEINVRMADAILITKVDSELSAHQQATRLEHLAKLHTPVFFGKSVVFPEAKDPRTGKLLSDEDAGRLIKDKRVLVIDDGPTLTHGGMPYGAGYVLAKELGGRVVDPRPYAQGSLKDTFRKFPHLKEVLPAMGYGDDQVRDLAATVEATPCDTVIIGTPSDLTHVLDVKVPSVVARYNLVVHPKHEEAFESLLDSFCHRFRLNVPTDPCDAA